MKYLILLLSLLSVQGCKFIHNKNIIANITSDSILNNKDSIKTPVVINSKEIVYSAVILKNFVDSIGKINPETYVRKIIRLPDSIFRSQKELDFDLQTKDFSELMLGCKEGVLRLDLINKIFPDFQIDSTNYKDDILNGQYPLTFYSFDDNQFEFINFAIVLGGSDLNWDCKVYFFNRNKLIAEHYVFHRYGLDLSHFKNSVGNTICFYRQNFQSGSGIWWFNNNFYMFDKNKLIPVLDELQEANLQYPWSIRSYWLKSSIEKTNPLTIKFVYYNEFPDPSNSFPIKIINDSTTVKYDWDKTNKQFIPDFSKSNLDRFKILTYYLADNELMFINTHYDVIKQLLNGDDTLKCRMAFSYLNLVKNVITRPENKASH